MSSTYIREVFTTFQGDEFSLPLAGITWSVTREQAPIYTMGSSAPRSFHQRSKRGYAGSMIFAEEMPSHPVEITIYPAAHEGQQRTVYGIEFLDEGKPYEGTLPADEPIVYVAREITPLMPREDNG